MVVSLCSLYDVIIVSWYPTDGLQAHTMLFRLLRDSLDSLRCLQKHKDKFVGILDLLVQLSGPTMTGGNVLNRPKKVSIPLVAVRLSKLLGIWKFRVSLRDCTCFFSNQGP